MTEDTRGGRGREKAKILQEELVRVREGRKGEKKEEQICVARGDAKERQKMNNLRRGEVAMPPTPLPPVVILDYNKIKKKSHC